MRICHVTPHLPPDQAANALLPYHLGCWAAEAGDEPCFLAHPPRQAGPRMPGIPLPGPVIWIDPVRRRGPIARGLKTETIAASIRLLRAGRRWLAEADLVHIHSNGLLAELCAWLAVRLGKPTVLTLYGTEIWHYRRKRLGVDLFTRAYRHASAVTFYSRGLMDFAFGLGLARARLHVVYPPIAAAFQAADREQQLAARERLGVSARHLLLNVKRLHPLAGQHHLIEAMPRILAVHPDTDLVICGTGPLADSLSAAARQLGVDGHVRFQGLVDNETVAIYNRAADLFVLPSLLEACPTVALEALASGTPVVSSDNPGGVELGALFGDDVTVVPRERPEALAAAVTSALSRARRTDPRTVDILEREFRPRAVAARYADVYREAIAATAR